MLTALGKHNRFNLYLRLFLLRLGGNSLILGSFRRFPFQIS
jgi:hypothetical protein